MTEQEKARKGANLSDLNQRGANEKNPLATISIADYTAKVNSICEILKDFAAACRYALREGNSYAALPMRAEDADAFEAAAELLEGLLVREADDNAAKPTKQKRGEPIGEFRNHAEAMECPLLSEALAAYEEMRIKKRKPLTDYARHLAICRLKAFSDDPAIQAQVVLQSVENGWTGLHSLKQGEKEYAKKREPSPQSSFSTDEFFEAALAASLRKEK